MPNVSVPLPYAGWFTFANYGPVTTTYTPPASCTATDRYRLGYVHRNANFYGFAQVGCPSTGAWDCVPSGTASATITALENDAGERFVGAGGYYSPGLYCPSGWATAGVVARDDSSSLSSSGVLSAPTQLAYLHLDNTPAMLLASLLKPSETIAVCCPSAMTADGIGGCYSIVSDYEPSVACSVSTETFFDYTSSTTVLKSPFVTTAGPVPTSTSYSEVTRSRTLKGATKSSLRAIAYVEMVTLMHHPSDRTAAQSGSTESTGTRTATVTPTTNAAGRFAPRGSTWDGLGAVLGGCIAAMALGAAVLL
ncbi:hypothetical protein N7492_005981 [Penicillium capsulatum]|uniref:Uncharacterized protein n=1 Tax=Penicillium capsulatum TaxID=69766 RepID=A0A9W9ID13_9EURO|nr:hypothetical protein N7492_005981 [Penicillium capsulatum]KAJ6134915.1 hypothetical protein N7512_000075 [Penicillium capsulatum]